MSFIADRAAIVDLTEDAVAVIMRKKDLPRLARILNAVLRLLWSRNEEEKEEPTAALKAQDGVTILLDESCFGGAGGVCGVLNAYLGQSAYPNTPAGTLEGFGCHEVIKKALQTFKEERSE